LRRESYLRSRTCPTDLVETSAAFVEEDKPLHGEHRGDMAENLDVVVDKVGHTQAFAHRGLVYPLLDEMHVGLLEICFWEDVGGQPFSGLASSVGPSLGDDVDITWAEASKELGESGNAPGKRGHAQVVPSEHRVRPVLTSCREHSSKIESEDRRLLWNRALVLNVQ